MFGGRKTGEPREKTLKRNERKNPQSREENKQQNPSTYVRWCPPYLGQFSGELTIASTPSNKNSSSCLRFTTVSAPFSSLAGFNCKVITIGEKGSFKPSSLNHSCKPSCKFFDRGPLVYQYLQQCANLDLAEMTYFSTG